MVLIKVANAILMYELNPRFIIMSLNLKPIIAAIEAYRKAIQSQPNCMQKPTHAKPAPIAVTQGE